MVVSYLRVCVFFHTDGEKIQVFSLFVLKEFKGQNVIFSLTSETLLDAQAIVFLPQ